MHVVEDGHRKINAVVCYPQTIPHPFALRKDGPPTFLLDQRPAGDAEVEVIEGAASRKRGAAVVEEAEADEVVAGDEELGGGAVRRDADDAAAALQRGRDVDVAVGIEREALRAAEALVEDAGVAVRCDRVDR